MTQIVVNGLILPSSLTRAVNEGIWRRPDDVALLRDVTGIPDAHSLVFMSPDEMARQHESDRRLVIDGSGADLGLCSRDLSGCMCPADMLDISQGLVFAAAHGDSGLALDYRNSIIYPSVLATRWSAVGCKWEQIALNFDEFLQQLGLR